MYCLTLYYLHCGQIEKNITSYFDIIRHCPLSVQVIQRRVDNTTDFNRNWKSYKEGFGDPTHSFWLGE